MASARLDRLAPSEIGVRARLGIGKGPLVARLPGAYNGSNFPTCSMRLVLRAVRAMPLAAAITASTMAEARAGDSVDCARFDREEILQSIQVFRIPALLESTPDGFHLENPGTLTEEARQAIHEIVERLACSTMDQSDHASGTLPHFKVVVLAGTDARAAKRFWGRLRIDTKESQELANMIVNLAASSTRGRVVVEEFRTKLHETIVKSPDLARLSPSDPGLEAKALAVANLVVPSATIFEGPALPAATPLRALPSESTHPRDFTVIVITPGDEEKTLDKPARSEEPTKRDDGSRDESKKAADESAESQGHGNGSAAADISSSKQEEPPTWPNSRGSILLAGGVSYLRVLHGDHLGPSLTCLYSPRLLKKKRKQLGVMFGIRGAALFTSRTYRLSSTLTSSALPFLESMALGFWQPVKAFEVRLALALGAVLPVQAFSGYLEAGVAVNLPSRFEVSVAGSGGLLVDPDTRGRWGGIVAIGREF